MQPEKRIEKAVNEQPTGRKAWPLQGTSGLFSQTGSLKLTTEHDQTTKRCTSEDLLLLNQFWKLRVSSRTHNNRHMATKGFLWTAKFSGGGHPPGGQGRSQHLTGLTKRIGHPARSGWKHRWLCTEEICAAVNSLEEWAPARHWLELLNKKLISLPKRVEFTKS